MIYLSNALDCKAILWDSFKMIRKSLDNYGRVYESWSTKQKQNVNRSLIEVLFDGDKERQRSLDNQYRKDKEAMSIKDRQLLQCFNLSAMSISRYKEGRNLLLDMCFVKGPEEIVAVAKAEVPDGEEVLNFEDLPVEEKVAQVAAAKKKGAAKKTGTKTREVKKDSLSDALHKALDLAKVQGNDLLTASIIKCIEMAKLSVPSATHAKQVAKAEDEVFDLWDETLEQGDKTLEQEDEEDIFANFG